jgi:hypothetical protein
MGLLSISEKVQKPFENTFEIRFRKKRKKIPFLPLSLDLACWPISLRRPAPLPLLISLL